MQREPIRASFIVPTLNEAPTLPGLLSSIAAHCPPEVAHEILVVDNGSTDETVRLAKDMGLHALIFPTANVGQLRNEGAKRASGEILIFLDADIRLSALWRRDILNTLMRIRSDPRIISGSSGRASEGSGWIARAWSTSPTTRPSSPTHIGTGHMIVHRHSFLELGGFDPRLETGEDYEFCQRARGAGFKLQPNDSLWVTHVRLPSTIRDFLRREIWHGSGDTRDLRRVVTSPVAVSAIVFAALHVATGLWLLVTPSTVWAPGAGVAVLGIMALSVLGAVRRGGADSPWRFMQRSVLFYFYFWARFFAISRRAFRMTEEQDVRTKPDRGW